MSGPTIVRFDPEWPCDDQKCHYCWGDGDGFYRATCCSGFVQLSATLKVARNGLATHLFVEHAITVKPSSLTVTDHVEAES